MKCWICK